MIEDGKGGYIIQDIWEEKQVLSKEPVVIRKGAGKQMTLASFRKN